MSEFSNVPVGKYYSSKQDALERVILPSLGEYASEHDTDAIFNRAFKYVPGFGFWQNVSRPVYWVIVAQTVRKQGTDA